MITVKIEQASDGYVYEIEGVNRLNGKRVKPNDRIEKMLEEIAEVILGYKCEVKRR